MLASHNRQSIKSLIIFGSGLAYVLSIVMMEVLVGFALGDISDSLIMQALVGIGILGTFLSACLIPLALHYWLAPGTQFIVGILFWLIDVVVLAINATTSYQLIKQLELSSFFTMWQLAIPFIGPAITIIGWGLVYLADDGQKDRQSDRLLETSKRALMREAEYARVSAEHEFAMKQIAQVKQSLMMALQASDIAKVAEQGAYNSALTITRQIVGLPIDTTIPPSRSAELPPVPPALQPVVPPMPPPRSTELPPLPVSSVPNQQPMQNEDDHWTLLFEQQANHPNP